MSFEQYELGQKRGRKVRLITFNYLSNQYFITDNSKDIVINNVTYNTTPSLTISSIQQSADSDLKNQVTVVLPFTLNPSKSKSQTIQNIGSLWFPYPVQSPVFIKIEETYLEDDDEEINTTWRGRIIGASYTVTSMTLTCDMKLRASSNKGISVRVQRTATMNLYDQSTGGGNLLPSAIPVTLSLVEGNKLTSDDFLNIESLAGGYITWTDDDSITHQASILAQKDNTITLINPEPTLTNSSQISCFVGTDNTLASYQALNNAVNYSGFVNIPINNPLEISQQWG